MYMYRLAPCISSLPYIEHLISFEKSVKDDSVQKEGTIYAALHLLEMNTSYLHADSISLIYMSLSATFGETVTTSKHNYILS